MGTAWAVVYAATPMVMSEMVIDESRATYFSYLTGTQQIGIGVGPVIAGVLVETDLGFRATSTTPRPPPWRPLSEAGQIRVPVQHPCGQENLLKEEDASELVLRVVLFEQHQGQVLLLPNGEVLPQPLLLKPGMHSRPDTSHLDAAEGGGTSEVLCPPLARRGRCMCVQPQLQPVDETVEHWGGRIGKVHRSFTPAG
jgi:hypothetical protein